MNDNRIYYAWLLYICVVAGNFYNEHKTEMRRVAYAFDLDDFTFPPLLTSFSSSSKAAPYRDLASAISSSFMFTRSTLEALVIFPSEPRAISFVNHLPSLCAKSVHADPPL